MPTPSDEAILQRICDYLEETMDDGPRPMSSTTLLVDDLHLDSMQMAEMICDLEDHFDIALDGRELESAATLADVAAAVTTSLAQQSGH